MSESVSREGGCQCGNIRYRLTATPFKLYVCHCRHCQKQSSSAFGMSLIMDPGKVEFIRGEAKRWITYGDSGTTKICAFCDNCGTRIYHGDEDPKAAISIKAGSLDDTSWLAPTHQIWTSRAQPWVPLDPQRYRLHPYEPEDD